METIYLHRVGIVVKLISFVLAINVYIYFIWVYLIVEVLEAPAHINLPGVCCKLQQKQQLAHKSLLPTRWTVWKECSYAKAHTNTQPHTQRDKTEAFTIHSSHSAKFWPASGATWITYATSEVMRKSPCLPARAEQKQKRASDGNNCVNAEAEPDINIKA